MHPAEAMSRIKLWQNLDDSPMGRGSRFPEGLLSVFGQTSLATAGQPAGATVLFAKFAKEQYGRSILEQLHGDEHMKILTVTTVQGI